MTSRHDSLDGRATISDSKYVCAGRKRTIWALTKVSKLVNNVFQSHPWNEMPSADATLRLHANDATRDMRIVWPCSGSAQSAVAFASISRVPTCRAAIMPRSTRSQICDRHNAIAVFARSTCSALSVSRPARPRC